MSKQPRQIVFAVDNAPKIGRKSGAKSKNGCLTCKARHIKCTEEKPVCQRCTLSGKQCAGYAPQVDHQSRSRGGTPSTGQTSAWNDLSLTVDAALGLPSRSIDRRYLDHFRNRSAKALSRLGDQEFWDDIVLRLSTSRPTVQYALLALSAQHEAHTEGGIVALTCDSAASVYGLGQYSKGIKSLKQTLANATSEFDLLEVVVACVLFASFEILQGNGNGAMRHGRGGLQILSSQIKQRTAGGDSEEIEAVLHSKPAKLLIRLDVDTATYMGFDNVHELAIPPACPFLTMQNHEPVSNHEKKFVLKSVIKARDDLYTHLARNYYFERNFADSLRLSNLQERSLNPASYQDDSRIPSQMLEWQEYLLTNMRDWNEHLQALAEPLLAPSWNTRFTGTDKCRLTIIREYASISVACMSSYMSVYTCLASDEEAQGLYDNLLPQFRCLVQNAEIIVLPEVSLNIRPSGWESSVLDMQGVIQPLAFAASKCRDRVLRNHALYLLSMSGRRGGWDGQNMARVVRCVVEYEERQAREEEQARKEKSGLETQGNRDSQEAPSWIPLCARVYTTELDIDKINRRVSIWMKCARDEIGFTDSVVLNDHLVEYVEVENVGGVPMLDVRSKLEC